MEWLVTSGNGAYASAELDGRLTRAYHGLLVAALDGPAERTLLLVKIDEIATFAGETFALSTNAWSDGIVDPQGDRFLDRFYLDGTTPVWEYVFADAVLEKRVAMEPGVNATSVRYTLLRGGPVHLALKAIVDHRDFHGNTRDRGGPSFAVDDVAGAICVRPPFAADAELWLRADGGSRSIANVWYRNYDLPAERERGLEATEDHVHAATFAIDLTAGRGIVLRAATDSEASAGRLDGAFARSEIRAAAVLRAWGGAQPHVAVDAPAAIRRLVLAADQFVVTRALPDLADGRSIVAGYPWFGDWGRDAMIALPGLLLTTGRPDVARAVVRTFGRLIDGGMLPNTIPNHGAPAYNTADAALWFVEAVRAYVSCTNDATAIDEFFPMMRAIVDAYTAGTRYGIGVDPADGLVAAGVPGMQLTWMDAKVGDRVVTPRIGKPVEINALWYNALSTLAVFAPHAGADGETYRARAARVRTSFGRYLGGADGGLLDVLDGPEGDDASLRPNQIFAASLPYSPLGTSQRRSVVETCERNLLTPYGLRSLAPSDPAYVGRYAGDVAARDGAYHQGTVWPWLIGPFAIAHARAFHDVPKARAYLDPSLARLDVYGVGTLGELADGDAPFAPRGAIAQAWSVGEVLRAWHELAPTDSQSRT